MKDLERVEFHLRALVGGIWRLTRIHDLLVIQRDASRIQQFLQKTSKNHCGLVFCCLKNGTHWFCHFVLWRWPYFSRCGTRSSFFEEMNGWTRWKDPFFVVWFKSFQVIPFAVLTWLVKVQSNASHVSMELHFVPPGFGASFPCGIQRELARQVDLWVQGGEVSRWLPQLQIKHRRLSSRLSTLLPPQGPDDHKVCELLLWFHFFRHQEVVLAEETNPSGERNVSWGAATFTDKQLL